MHIVHILTADLPVTAEGGAQQRRARALADVQAEDGHEVTILSPGEPAASFRDSGASVQPVLLRSTGIRRDLEYAYRCVRNIRDRGPRPNIIHSHAFALSGVVARLTGVPSVLNVDYFYYRGGGTRAGKVGYARLLSYNAALLPVSTFVERRLTEYFPAIATTVTTVPNGVDLGWFSQGETAQAMVREEFGLPENFALYLGRISEQKGSDLLPGLARALAEQGMCLVVAGPVERFTSNAASSVLTNDIGRSGGKYIGKVPEALLPGLLSAASVLVLPTRRFEMFGMVIVEAAAAGTPCVASDLGGIPEAMGGGGILVPVGDQEELNRQVIGLLHDRDRCRELGAAAKAHASRFDWRSVNDMTMRMYERALQS